MAMDWENAVEQLRQLAQLDIDAWHAYDQALEHLDESVGIRHQFAKYREDHRRHVAELSARLEGYGENTPEFSPSFKGYLIEGFTVLRGVTGVQGVLAAMRQNEQLTNRRYAEALERELPPEIRPLIEENYRDEQDHLRFIEEKLDLLVREKDSPERSQYY